MAFGFTMAAPAAGSPRAAGPDGRRSALAGALAACRSGLVGIALFSGLSNLLMLTGSIFMLEVYDRVLPSRSVPTLVGLALLAALLYGFQGVLDLLRSRLFLRIGQALDEAVGQRVFAGIVRLPLKARGGGDGLQPLRDLDQLRGFLSAGGPSALFDLPWIPLYLGLCFLFHFWIGMTALAGALLLIGIALATEIAIRAPSRAVAGHALARSGWAAAGRRNSEVLQAMGMAERLGALWGEANRDYLAAHRRASDIGTGLGTLSRVLRLILQSAVLGVGAWLVIHQEATGGVIIASSILVSRALAPVELSIAGWKGFVAARQGWQRLDRLLELFPFPAAPTALPRPAASLSVEGLSVSPPGETRAVVQEVAFALQAGQALGVIGPTASGKSSLARALVGVWPALRGKVRLDGAALEQWSPERLGPALGYLPQDVELFDGSVADNIARFQPDADPAAIVAAARAAGVHELILRLPEGYDSRIGEGGTALSAGHRQRIGLARALYGDPFLVVLDEPNSNLDSDGEEALGRAIAAVRARGGIAVVIAHRPSALGAVDQLLVMGEGRAQAWGPRDEVLAKVLRRPGAAPLKVVAEGPVQAQGGVR
ncbi:MAG: type I secretion system permease/ATPase [Dongiaceae bacterium]